MYDLGLPNHVPSCSRWVEICASFVELPIFFLGVLIALP
jgi:hypothetical protein